MKRLGHCFCAHMTTREVVTAEDAISCCDGTGLGAGRDWWS